MVRPRLCKKLRFKPKAHYFKPQGIPMFDLKETILSKEEMETLKLKYFDKMDQTKAAEKMNTSQSTFQRILTSAKIKITGAIVRGNALKIEE